MVILRLIRDIESRHTIKSIIGHRDASPDLDGDGTIEEDEWTKECPCFDVACEYGNLTNG
jgi:N-acetyl-anhydromuramyl-L-alanine amidase AmpD